jgi:hypothetical protein
MVSRRFNRIKFDDQCVVEYGSRSIKGRLLNISLNGALVEFSDHMPFLPGDRWRLSFHLGNADFIMQFGSEVVHTNNNMAGFRFIETDLNTMFHLRNLLEARTSDPGLIRRELELLFSEDPSDPLILNDRPAKTDPAGSG